MTYSTYPDASIIIRILFKLQCTDYCYKKKTCIKNKTDKKGNAM